MLRALLLLAVGESLALFGLWLAWVPLAFVAAGVQAIAGAAFIETGPRK